MFWTEKKVDEELTVTIGPLYVNLVTHRLPLAVLSKELATEPVKIAVGGAKSRLRRCWENGDLSHWPSRLALSSMRG